jgi:hypothetical protein
MKLLPHPMAAPGEMRLLFTTDYPGKNRPWTYDLPGGVITQSANRQIFMATNTTTKLHPLYPGKVDRMIVRSGGKIWAVTHGVGYNAYFGRTGAELNLSQGPRLFRDLDRALQRAWQAQYGQ